MNTLHKIYSKKKTGQFIFAKETKLSICVEEEELQLVITPVDLKRSPFSLVFHIQFQIVKSPESTDRLEKTTQIWWGS